jgi:argininosuccinate lyase
MSKNAMWGGRFDGGPAEIMEKINASIGFDKALYKQDIQGSKAHSAMLAAQGILTEADRDAIHAGLDEIEKEIEAGVFDFKTELEDIHMNVESRLREKIGDAGARLHTGRSRNDQVVTDVRLWLRDALDGLDGLMRGLQEALIDQAEANADTLMPGYTHLQSAQPVTFGHHLMAYVEMVGRDRGRLRRLPRALERMPAGRGGAGRDVFSRSTAR